MNTQVWGSSAWELVHAIAQNVNVQTQEKTRVFLKIFNKVLPCRHCRESSELILNNPKNNMIRKLHNIDRSEFALWVYEFHNLVNWKLEKDDETIPSFREVQEKYKEFLLRPSFTHTYPIGYDFLFSIVFNYPTLAEEQTTEKNEYYSLFFNLLKDIYPYKDIRLCFQTYEEKYPFEKTIGQYNKMQRWIFNLFDFTSKCVQGEMQQCYEDSKSACEILSIYKSRCEGQYYNGRACLPLRIGDKLVYIKDFDPKLIKLQFENHLFEFQKRVE